MQSCDGHPREGNTCAVSTDILPPSPVCPSALSTSGLRSCMGQSSCRTVSCPELGALIQHMHAPSHSEGLTYLGVLGTLPGLGLQESP